MNKIAKSLIALGVTTLVSTHSNAASYEFRTPLNATTTFVQSEEKPDKPVERGPIDINGYCNTWALTRNTSQIDYYVTQQYIQPISRRRIVTFNYQANNCKNIFNYNYNGALTDAYNKVDAYAESDLRFLGKERNQKSIMEYGNKILSGDIVPEKVLFWEKNMLATYHFKTKEAFCKKYSDMYTSELTDRPWFYNACLTLDTTDVEPADITEWKNMTTTVSDGAPILLKNGAAYGKRMNEIVNTFITESELKFVVEGMNPTDQTDLLNVLNQVKSITIENNTNLNVKLCTSLSLSKVVYQGRKSVAVSCTNFRGDGNIAIPNDKLTITFNK